MCGLLPFPRFGTSICVPTIFYLKQANKSLFISSFAFESRKLAFQNVDKIQQIL
jgi:hypothetical protein